MRRSWVIVGIIVLVVGALLASIPYLFPMSTTIPQYPSGVIETPQLLGSGTMTVKWSGAPSATWVAVYECTSSACSSLVRTVSNVTGSSGTISFAVTGGTSYLITSSGGSGGVAATIAVSGIGAGTIAGIVIAVIGAVLAGIGARKAPRAARSASPTRAPASEVSDGTYSATTGAADQGDVVVAEPSPAALTAGNRPALKCAYCGTLNEPWITNCRKCKRPLATTGR